MALRRTCYSSWPQRRDRALAQVSQIRCFSGQDYRDSPGVPGAAGKAGSV